jgi:SAM-dependent methyltransferase
MLRWYVAAGLFRVFLQLARRSGLPGTTLSSLWTKQRLLARGPDFMQAAIAEHVFDEAYYQANYKNYDAQTPASKLEFYRSLLLKWVPPHSPVFELGVAMGHFLKSITGQYELIGSDINEYGIREARKRVPDATLFVGSHETIPDDGQVQAVVSWDVLEHLPDIDAGLTEIYEKLPAGGVLIGVVPIYDGLLGWLVRCLDKDPTHVTKVGRQDWVELLESAGFEVVEFGGILRKLVGQKYVHITSPQMILRHCCSAVYFVARKN